MCLVDDGQLGSIVLLLQRYSRVDVSADLCPDGECLVCPSCLHIGYIARGETLGDEVESHFGSGRIRGDAVDLPKPVGCLVAGGIIFALFGWLLWRSHIYNKVLLEKNRHLLADAEQREQEEQQAIEQLKAEPEEQLTSEQKLFRRICDLMDSSDRIYTNAGLGRNHLAQLLGTNEHYITDAISACTNGKSVNGFLNEYRLRYAAHLLVTTQDPVALIAELAGFSRSSFFRIFSEAYGMSPSDYRKVAVK